MKVIITHDEQGAVIFQRERELDSEFDSIVEQTMKDKPHGKLNEIRFYWETWEKE